MNKKYFISTMAMIIATTASLMAVPLTYDITNEIPEISAPGLEGYEKISDVAQYKNADWSHVVGLAKDIPIEEAKKIADNNSEITFFFYMKGCQMILEKEDGSYRVFYHRDAVFFSGEPSWGTAPDYADGYIKH